MISKEKLTFDPTDANSIAASDSVGAYVRASDGSLIAATSNALHVSDGGGSLTVDASNLDIRDLVFATDKVDVSGSSVALDAGTLAALESITVQNGAGASAVNIQDGGNSITVDGTVTALQGTSPWVIGDGGSSISVDDNGGSLTVDASDLDIRDLSAASDSVAAWLKDGSGNSISSTGGALDVNIQSSDIEIDVEDDKANTALLSTQKNVSSTGALLASQLADRRFLWVQNLGPNSIFLGASGVTSSNGIRFSNGAIGEFRFGPALSLHAVSSAGTCDVRLLEAS